MTLEFGKLRVAVKAIILGVSDKEDDEKEHSSMLVPHILK
jgi:hypothetical protein